MHRQVVAAEKPDLEAISSGLVPRGEGLWITRGTSDLSFPEAGFDQNYIVEESSFWFRHRTGCILELVSAFPPPGGGVIFDIGGGNGAVSRSLIDAGYRVVLVEPGSQGVQYARSRGVAHIICGTVGQAGFEPGSLDAAGLFDVLEHIEDDRAFLEEIHDLLIPGGRLYMTMPAYSGLWSAEDIYAGHFRRYSAEALVKKLESVGYETDFCTYIFRWLPVPIYLVRALPFRISGGRQRISDSDTSSDHLVARPRLHRFLGSLFSRELAHIKNRSRIRFGASILVAVSAR